MTRYVIPVSLRIRTPADLDSRSKSASGYGSPLADLDPPYQTYSLMTETNLQKGGLVHWVPCTKSREKLQEFEISFDEK